MSFNKRQSTLYITAQRREDLSSPCTGRSLESHSGGFFLVVESARWIFLMILIPGRRIHWILSSGPKLVNVDANQITNLPCHCRFKDRRSAFTQDFEWEYWKKNSSSLQNKGSCFCVCWERRVGVNTRILGQKVSVICIWDDSSHIIGVNLIIFTLILVCFVWTSQPNADDSFVYAIEELARTALFIMNISA